jgi:hypothetical protein
MDLHVILTGFSGLPISKAGAFAEWMPTADTRS